MELGFRISIVRGFRIRRAALRIPKPTTPDSKSKNFPDSQIWFTLHGAIYRRLHLSVDTRQKNMFQQGARHDVFCRQTFEVGQLFLISAFRSYFIFLNFQAYFSLRNSTIASRKNFFERKQIKSTTAAYSKLRMIGGKTRLKNLSASPSLSRRRPLTKIASLLWLHFLLDSPQAPWTKEVAASRTRLQQPSDVTVEMWRSRYKTLKRIVLIAYSIVTKSRKFYVPGLMLQNVANSPLILKHLLFNPT